MFSLATAGPAGLGEPEDLKGPGGAAHDFRIRAPSAEEWRYSRT